MIFFTKRNAQRNARHLEISQAMQHDALLGRSQADSERAELLQRLRDERGRLASAERSLDLPALHASALEYQKIARQMMLLDLQKEI